MIGILLFIMGLAGVFGFFLGVYFFFYRVNLRGPWRNPVGIVGGVFTGILMAGLTLVMLLPPMSYLILAGGLILGGFIAILIVVSGKGGQPEEIDNQELKVVLIQEEL